MSIRASHVAWYHMMMAKVPPRMLLRSSRIPFIALVLLLMAYLAWSSHYAPSIGVPTSFRNAKSDGNAVSELASPSIDPLTGESVPWPTPKRLAHIPPKIWQVYLAFDPKTLSYDYLHSWISLSPSYAYTLIDAAGAHELLTSALGPNAGEHYTPDALELYYMISRQVMRVDFLRYLALAEHGGVYSDTDTRLEKPLDEWVPEQFRNQTRVIVGIEADQSPPVAGTLYEVQFCQWTLAGAKNHPLYWAMVDRILGRIRQGRDQALEKMALSDDGTELRRQKTAEDVKLQFSNNDILNITGPMGWSRLIYEYFSNETGTEVTWHNFTGMTEPRLIGDVLVLPIDGFATGVPHSNASRSPGPGTMAVHMFSGSWKAAENGR